MQIETILERSRTLDPKVQKGTKTGEALATGFEVSGPYFEFKYLVDARQMPAVQHYLRHYFSAVQSFGKGINRTIYFDTAKRELLENTLVGESNRAKIRLRENISTGAPTRTSLEIKFRNSLSVTKRRIVMSRFESQWLLNLPSLISQLSPEDCFDLTADSGVSFGELAGTLWMDYQRERFVGLRHGMRANLDTEIMGTAVALSPGTIHSQQVTLPYSVLEIKSPTPPELPREFQALGLVRASMSKYVQLMEEYRLKGVLT